MPSDPSDPSELPSQLTTLQILGLSSPGGGEWSHLRGLQHFRLHRGVPIRSLAQLLAMVLALALVAGKSPAWQLAMWSVVALAAVAHAARRDRELFRIRRHGLATTEDIWRHASGAVGCAAVWAVPLLLPDQYLGGRPIHLALWTLTAMLAAGFSLTTRAAPLSTLLFVVITGLAGVVGFVLHGEWALAAMGLAFLAVALYGTLDGARSYLAARLAEAGLADKEKLVSLLLREFEEHDADWLWQIDTARRVRRVSRRFAYALGQEPEELEGRSFLELAAGEGWASGAVAPSLRELANLLRHRRSFSDQLVQVHVGGEERWWKLSGAPWTDESGRFLGYRGVGSDVTARHVSEQRIAYLARHDVLTGLPNRSMLMEALQDGLRTVERRGGRCALLLIDLDRFKAVNDTLGHPIGDKLLVQVAGRLTNAVAERGLYGRLGGDEFAVVVPNAHITEVDKVAQAVIGQLSQLYEVDGHQISIGASVGSAEGPRDGAQVEALMRHADLALYRAKSTGRGVHYRYMDELQMDATERRDLELSLQHAIERGELLLVYQPEVDATAEQLTGFEALLRWPRGEQEAIGPDRFILLAEATRLILPIGGWVLEEACRQATRWPDPLKVAINISGSQLLEPDFTARVRKALSDSGLPPPRLQLEVTESTLLSDPGGMLATLESVRELGCGIALDDFGTGASSLSQLGRVRFAAVKIDHSFVRGAARGNAEELATIRAVVAMAQSIGMIVTAEGVETAEEAVLMRGLGCERLQGFFYGRPMSGADALALACRRPPVSESAQGLAPAPPGQFAAA